MNEVLNDIDINNKKSKKNFKFILGTCGGIILILIIFFIVFFSRQKKNWTLDKNSDEDMCAQAFEVIYEDEKYNYTVSNSCVANYKVVYSNGDSYTLNEALSQGKVTVDELINKGVVIYKDKK